MMYQHHTIATLFKGNSIVSLLWNGKQCCRALMALMLITSITFTHSAHSRDAIDSLPNLGSSSARYLSKQQADILGAAYIRQARNAMTFINDPILKDYINQLGNRLIQHIDSSPNAPETFTFYIVKNPAINAFTVPGGHIVIHTGLIESADNEAELASVLAHEIAHITQNHSARGIESSRYDTLISLATVLVAIASGSAEAAQAGITAGSGALIQKQLAYTRSFEREADAAGIRLLFKAGYPPSATSDFLHKLSSADRFNGANAPEFLRSHPITVSRISEAEQRIKSYPSTEKPIDNNEFLDIQARISALYGNNPRRLSQELAKKIADQTHQKIQVEDRLYYQYGLSLVSANQPDKAIPSLQQATTLSPDKIAYQVALAEAELETTNQATGLERLKNLYERHTSQTPSIGLYYANALILMNQSKRAIPILQTIQHILPDEPDTYIMLARAYGENGQLFDSYVARSEYHYRRGNFTFAIKQLDNAIATAPNNIEKSILKAKQAQIKQELAETKKALN